MHEFDVLVVGGGHAGVEAACAAARMGAQTGLVSLDPHKIGAMSCNPAIGGLGKGHLVREVDALDGVIARAADAAAIHYRMLNRSKGSAVWGPRVQADRSLFRTQVQAIVAEEALLTVIAGEAAALLLSGGAVSGLTLADGTKLVAPAVVLCTGTFLGGVLYRGEERFEGGRIGEGAAHKLAEQLRCADLPMGRLKTGTPPRLDGRTIDWASLEEQASDSDNWTMSALSGARVNPQVFCAITRTNERAHDIIRANLDRSPLFSGAIGAAGPRYCPSIEDKIHRFADKDQHQVFIEPEGLTTHELYPNGISTSLPFDVQLQIVRSIKGMENAHILRPGYAIEYDYFNPQDLKYSLETKVIDGLFFAGQINGTTGYEEAGAQGLLAGLNAALRAQERDAWCPRRDEAYIGVLVDDLITMGTREPYRMFTSRAEYRLVLREDNADLRLTEKGRELGLVDDERWAVFNAKREAIEQETQRLRSTWMQPNSEQGKAYSAQYGTPLTHEYSLLDLLRRPEVDYTALVELTGASDIPADAAEQVEIQAKYAGYIERQQEEIERLRQHEQTRLPEDLDYASLNGLSNEIRAKLADVRPQTLGQASRIPGVTPAAVSLLLIHLKKRNALGDSSLAREA